MMYLNLIFGIVALAQQNNLWILYFDCFLAKFCYQFHSSLVRVLEGKGTESERPRMKIWAQNIQNWARKDRTARLYLAVRMAADGPYGLSFGYFKLGSSTNIYWDNSWQARRSKQVSKSEVICDAMLPKFLQVQLHTGPLGRPSKTT